MARWHGKLCSEPRVTVRQDGNPCCDSCGIKCDWQELIKTQAFANSPYLIPQNEKPGELNLWWPSSVPYSAKSKDNSTTQSPVPPTNTQHSPTPVYPTVLASHEFRLVCLDANENPESPVHLTIEAFPQDDAPDYETVSYTWGGEAADSTPTKPIFIGPYWDVVFQTTNCWEMLRFIRPWRGIRMIWVDAICINQQSNLERADQVASMMQIYRNCTRVIVYLGPDIAVPPHGRFPPRRRLDDLALGPDQDQAAFKKLLQRRYFRRIWVIQELILPPQAVIPIRGVNYWADAMVYSRLKSVPDWDWNKTAAPWLQHTAQGGIWEGDLAHILRTTAKSRSSDPRDQVFGILGLVNHGPTFQADYGISAQHVFVGLFAHLISNLKFLDIFYHATGASPRSRTSLTWMPLWDLTSTWDTTFDPPPPLDMIMADTLIRSLKPAVKVSCYINFNNSWSRVVGSPHTSAASRGNVSRYIKLSSSQSVTEAHTTSIAFAGWQRATSTHKPWHTGLSFDAGAGTLSLVLTHFCPIPLQPKKIGSLGEWTMFEVRGSQGSLFLASRDPLDLIYHPNQDHLFILNPGEGSELWYLVLRLVGDSGRWTLVSTCRAMFLSLDADASDIAKGVEIRIEPGFQSLYQLLEPAARAFENRQLDEIAGILPGVKSMWDLFPAYRGWCKWNVSRNSHHNKLILLESFISCLDPKLQPYARICMSVEGYEVLEVKIPPSESNASRSNSGISAASSQGNSSLGRRKSIWRSFKMKKKSAEEKIEETGSPDHGILSKASPFELARILETYFRPVESVRRTLGLRCDELEELLRPGLQEEQHLVGVLNFGGKMDDFNIDGNTVEVSIL